MEDIKLKLDSEGLEFYTNLYKSLLKDQEKLGKQLSNYRTIDIEKYKELLKELHLLNVQINTVDELIKNAEIVEKHNDSNLLDIGDVVRIKTIFSEDEIEEDTYELVAANSDFNSEIIKLSINTPLGKALYKAKVGDTVTYKYNDITVKVNIMEKVNVKKLKLN